MEDSDDEVTGWFDPESGTIVINTEEEDDG